MSKNRNSKLAAKRKQSPSRQPAESEQQIIYQETTFGGPIPAPVILEQYEKLLPGSADRILAMAENESRHQKEIEMSAITLQAKENRRGQYFGVIVTALAFVTASVALFLDHPAAASVIGGTTVVGLAAAFIAGKKQA